ncbi:MAG: hypothetical protein U5N58_00615 [Actinomycetota bacterium]|nr:hypothetical protein [Actinomycetota bacterium]
MDKPGLNFDPVPEAGPVPAGKAAACLPIISTFMYLLRLFQIHFSRIHYLRQLDNQLMVIILMIMPPGKIQFPFIIFPYTGTPQN